MSQHSPTGFAFGILFEIAAVVAIVAFLPRIDLQPPTTSSAGQQLATAGFSQPAAADPAITPVGWTSLDGNSANMPRQTSYYERTATQVSASPSPAGSFPNPTAPPLIESDPARTQYVEQRLDRASQQLVNSVGTAVAQTVTDWRRYPPSATATPPAAASPQDSTAARRPRTGATTSQHRPWIRY